MRRGASEVPGAESYGGDSLLTAVRLVGPVGAVGLVVAHEVGLQAVATVTHKVCDRGAAVRPHHIWKTHRTHADKT